VTDEMTLAKMFNSVAAARICKLPIEKGVMGLLLTMLWGNTLGECVNTAQNDYRGNISEAQKWYL